MIDPAPKTWRVHYYHTDQIGTPRELTSDTGEIVWSVTYQAWGNTLREQWFPEVSLPEQAPHPHPLSQPLRFQGQYFDEETGLHYNRFRYYDPDCGRFISQDPIGLPGGINLYQYAPNPITWIDPWGLDRCSCEAGKLRANMMQADKPEPAYANSAHHIVMSGSTDRRMAALRKKMDELGIDISHESNGAFLPTSSKVKEVTETSAHAHSRIHTDIYKQNVYDRLINQNTHQEFLDELSKISNELLDGTFPK